jgi:hypothetical protein
MRRMKSSTESKSRGGREERADEGGKRTRDNIVSDR